MPKENTITLSLATLKEIRDTVYDKVGHSIDFAIVETDNEYILRDLSGFKLASIPKTINTDENVQ